jgi:DNA-binding response OmpR family regulator
MKKRILIADDQPEVRKLVRLTLSKHYELREVADGASAYEAFCSEPFDALILDVMMPGTLDGCELCRMVKLDASLPKPVVVLLSARGQLADQEMGRKAGADAYVVKPFSPQKLAELVDSLLRPASCPVEN